MRKGDETAGMSDADFERKLIELDRLLNDPDVPMQAARIWTLAAEVARHGAPTIEDAHKLLSSDFYDALTSC